jgi:hypothetical protein
MIKTFTLEKLVLFVYDEISDPVEKDELLKAIRTDSELYEKYNELVETRGEIDNSFSSPSDETVNNILSYSKALDVLKTKDHKTIGLVMN